MLLITAIAATLVVQAVDRPAATDAPSTQADQTTAAPPPTDAATLISQFDAEYAQWGELIAELAARKARERYLAELLLPVVTRSDLDDGASGEILRETHDTIAEVEHENAVWAVRQLDPTTFAALELAQPRMAQDILRWAEREGSARARIVAALEPVTLAGRSDPQAFAEMADSDAISRNRPQIYGTASVCTDGHREPALIRARADLDVRRAAIGLGPMDEAWAAVIAAQGEVCVVSLSPE